MSQYHVLLRLHICSIKYLACLSFSLSAVCLSVCLLTASAGSSNGCSNNMGTCEQLCLPRPGGLFSCACATGFRLSADNRTCSPYQSYVVISMLTAIKGFSLEGADHSESMVPVAGRGGFSSTGWYRKKYY